MVKHDPTQRRTDHSPSTKRDECPHSLALQQSPVHLILGLADQQMPNIGQPIALVVGDANCAPEKWIVAAFPRICGSMSRHAIADAAANVRYWG